MTERKRLHQEAMNLSSQASQALANGEQESAAALWQQAFELEQKVAVTFLNDFENEPTRSVILRSAASLAFQCKKYQEAEKLAAMGLSGNPPAEIAQELRDIFEKVMVTNAAIFENVVSADGKPETLKGTLSSANGLKNYIQIATPNGGRRVKVPFGLNELVKRYWNKEIEILVNDVNGKYTLRNVIG